MSENNSLKSKYLNRVLNNSVDTPEAHKEMSQMTDELFIANGMKVLCHRDGDKFLPFSDIDTYKKIMAPAIHRLYQDMLSNGKLATIYDILKDSTYENDLMFEHPLLAFSSKKEEFLVKGKNEKEILEDRFKYLADIKDKKAKIDIEQKALEEIQSQLLVHKTGYHGCYPEINNLLKDVLGQEMKFGMAYEYFTLSKLYWSFLWSYMRTIAMVGCFIDIKKIYRMSDAIAKDFICGDQIILPGDALKYLPVQHFAIDVSRTPELSGYFDCIFVSVTKYANLYKISFEIFDTDGLHASCGMNKYIMIPEDKEFCLNAEELKKAYDKQTVEILNTFKLQEVIGSKPFNRENSTLLEDYRPAPPSAFKKAEKMILGTIFYLCCANKSTKKTAVKSNRSSNFSTENKDTSPIEIEDLGVREEQELEAEYQQAIINYNEIVNMGSHSETGRSSGSSTKKRKSPRPHMVNGHQSHVWRGKGENKVRVPIYIRPYWTGAKNNRIITVTTLR